jgi:hypothetical protein
MSRDCLRTTRISAPCSSFGARPELAHVPTKRPGIYCASCCPECKSPKCHDGPLELRVAGGER